MLNRLLVAIFGIPILVYIYYYGGIPLLVFTNLIVGIGLFEFFSMVEKSGKEVYSKFGIFIALLIVNFTYFSGGKPTEISDFGILLGSMIAMLVYRIFKNKVENTASTVGITLLGIIYVGVFFSKALSISFLENGGKILLVLQILVWLCDSCAYFVGVKFGRKIFKKGFSEISPKKSVEGAIGGTFFATLALFFINQKYSIFPESISGLETIIIGVTITLFIQIGDLVESMFKREFKIKDSGKILGEHGGILDRFDSLIFVLPISYFFIRHFIL